MRRSKISRERAEEIIRQESGYLPKFNRLATIAGMSPLELDRLRIIRGRELEPALRRKIEEYQDRKRENLACAVSCRKRHGKRDRTKHIQNLRRQREQKAAREGRVFIPRPQCRRKDIP